MIPTFTAWRGHRPNRTTLWLLTFCTIAGAIPAGCLLALQGLHSQGLI